MTVIIRVMKKEDVPVVLEILRAEIKSLGFEEFQVYVRKQL